MDRDNAKGEDPVARELMRHIGRSFGSNTNVEKAVLKYGRPFIGTARPKGYRQRARKECFRLADSARGFSVECYGLHYNYWLFQHAWVRPRKRSTDFSCPERPAQSAFRRMRPQAQISFLKSPPSCAVFGIWHAISTTHPDPRTIVNRKPCNFTIAVTRFRPRPKPDVCLVLSDR